VAIYNSFFVPMEYAFKVNDHSKFLEALDALIDWVFVFDIILMFFTSYINKGGQEVKDSIEIAKNYTNTFRFLTDFLSLLGMNIFEGVSPALASFGLFKIFRVFRINQFITNLNVSVDIKSTLKLIKLSFYLILWLHITGCGLWIFVQENSDVVAIRPTDNEPIPMMWYPPLDWVNYVDTKLYTSDKQF
jgi:hypothetical protein